MMLEPRKSLSLSWEEWHRDAKTLASRLLQFGPWRGIVAVSRGGLAPAAVVARALDIRLVETVCVIGYGPDEYNPQRAAEITVVKPPRATGPAASRPRNHSARGGYLASGHCRDRAAYRHDGAI